MALWWSLLGQLWGLLGGFWGRWKAFRNGSVEGFLGRSGDSLGSLVRTCLRQASGLVGRPGRVLGRLGDLWGAYWA
eukprot:1297585-Pyramimonas_sp.AAC.1